MGAATAAAFSPVGQRHALGEGHPVDRAGAGVADEAGQLVAVGRRADGLPGPQDHLVGDPRGLEDRAPRGKSAHVVVDRSPRLAAASPATPVRGSMSSPVRRFERVGQRLALGDEVGQRLVALVAVGRGHDGQRLLGLGEEVAERARPLDRRSLQQLQVVGSDVAVGFGRHERHEGDSVQFVLQRRFDAPPRATHPRPRRMGASAASIALASVANRPCHGHRPVGTTRQSVYAVPPRKHDIGGITRRSGRRSGAHASRCATPGPRGRRGRRSR